MRGLTDEELVVLQRLASPDKYVVEIPADEETHERLVNQGRAEYRTYEADPEFHGCWVATAQGHEALRLWPLVQGHWRG